MPGVAFGGALKATMLCIIPQRLLVEAAHQISIVTDPIPAPHEGPAPSIDGTAYLRARNKRLAQQSTLLRSDVESFKVQMDLQLPLWQFILQGNPYFCGPLGCIDDERDTWLIPRPATLPLPILGAKGYKVTLRQASLVQCRGGRERTRNVLEGVIDEARLLAFSDIDLEAGQGMDRAVEYMIGGEDRPCWNASMWASANQQIEEFWCGPDPEENLDYHELDMEPDFAHDVDIRFDLCRDRFVLGYHIFDERCGDAVQSDPFVSSVWWLLGNAPSAVALPPRSRRLQANALSAWLKQTA